MPLIILDGPDCAGKTTLANALAKQTGGKVTHLSYRFPGKMSLYHLAAMKHVAKSMPCNFHVLDRSWISEEIYGHVYRGGCENNTFNRQLHRIALKYGALYIICVPRSIDQYMEFYGSQHDSRDEMYEFNQQTADIWDCYQSLFTGDSKQRLPGYTGFIQRTSLLVGEGGNPYWAHYDIFDDNMSEVIDSSIELSQKLEDIQCDCFLNPKNHNGGGHFFHSKLILVGDRVNSKFRDLRYPFVDMGHCSAYLSEQLDLAGVAEEELIWVNAFGEDGKPNQQIRRVFECAAIKAQPPYVVLLGKNAQDAAGEMAISYGLKTYGINHPQWFKRFKNHESLLSETLIGIKNAYNKSHLPKAFTQHH